MIWMVEIAPTIFATCMAIQLQARWGEILRTDYGGEPIGFDEEKLREIILEYFEDKP